MLARELSPRESATDEELRAAEFLAGQFSGWGYEVQIQEFETINLGSATRLVILTPDRIDSDAGYYGFAEGGQPWMLSYPLDPRSVIPSEEYKIGGQLVYVGHGVADDFEGVEAAGKIALMQRGGGLSIAEKVALAAEAGSEAAVVFNNNPDEWWLYFYNRLVEDTEIPAIGINTYQGRALAGALLGGAELEVSVQKAPVSPL